MNILGRCVQLAASLAVVAGTGGCGSSAPADAQSQPDEKAVSARWVDNRLAVDVPVPVITFGLSPDSVAALRSALRPHVVDQGSGDFNQPLPPDLEEGQEDPTRLLPLFGESFPNPVLPTARFNVQAAPARLEGELREVLRSARVREDLFDANSVEDWLAGRLADIGLAPNANAPSIVVMHLESLGIGRHAWRFQGRTGFLEPVRVFGERHPLIVLDPSADRDPWSGTTTVYRDPVPENATHAIAAFVRDATEYRLLPASLYPVALAPCHAVTAIVGVRPAGISEATPLLRSVRDALHPEWIQAAFNRLSGGKAFLDLKVLSLPVDDPALDAIARGEFPAFEVLRAWLTLNWEQYHVDHPGCEEYMIVVFAGDVATVPGGGVLGIGTYDDSPGKRIAMGWVHEVFRLTFDPESPVCRFGCGGKDYLNWWDYLIIHEGGHIFGQHHTFHNGGSSGANESFSSVWSSMSYQDDGRCADFGAMDHANWMRNRAGFALLLATQAGREGSRAWRNAMRAASRLDWQGVWAALR